MAKTSHQDLGIPIHNESRDECRDMADGVTRVCGKSTLRRGSIKGVSGTVFNGLSNASGRKGFGKSDTALIMH